MMRLRRTVVCAALAWLLLIAVISTILASVQNINELITIARDPLATTGGVVSTDCKNHKLTYYRYEVNGKTYSGQSSRTDDCERLKAGNPIQIFYAREAPGISELFDPKKNLIGAIIFTGVTSIFSSTMIILLLWWKGFLRESASFGREH
jgi:hypothetical protein